jgi:uncharacterized protein (DUF433 family)
MTTKNLNFTDGVPLHETSDGNIRVIGSRVTMPIVVGAYRMGDSPAYIQECYPTLTLDQINSIIAWYLKNRADVDEYIREVDEQVEELFREIESRPESIAFREKMRSFREQMIKS